MDMWTGGVHSPGRRGVGGVDGSSRSGGGGSVEEHGNIYLFTHHGKHAVLSCVIMLRHGRRAELQTPISHVLSWGAFIV